MRAALLIRHGALDGDGEPRLVGAADLPMSAAGEARIRALAARLCPRLTPDAIYCSDLGRSRRTAALLTHGRDIPIHLRPALREIDLGAWQGLSRREVAARHPEVYAARGRDIVNVRPPGGESFADLAARVLPCWNSIVAARETEVVAIAGHAGVNRVILCHILGVPLANLFRIEQRLGCVNVVEWRSNEPAVKMIDGDDL
jgi:alpha-ribazole phosphatase